MESTLRIEDLDRLVLVWLVVPRKKPSHRSLASMLSPFVRGTGAAPESVARQCLARLKTRRDIEGDTSWMLTPGGRQKALAALGIPSLPKRASWKWVHSLLVARGHGIDVTPAALRRVATAEGLAAVVLEKHYQLQDAGRSELTLAQVGNAVAWRELNVESTAPFTLKAVLTYILRKTVDVSETPKDSKAALRTLASSVMNVNRGDAPIRAALVRRWMTEGDTEAVMPTAAPVVEAPPMTLQSFSQRALAAARSSTTGRWGDQKVFVSHVWNEYQRRDGGSTGDLDAFKQMLVRANQAGFLSLSRADLVEEMDPADVQRSEIASLGATFHFVRLD
ncbi:hypothetical protein WME98_08010 [Sorangium sp. So ce296]|uniref:hypothetical protein n=1 Tax=Sorangium sp. So ce296 TaxID=3133296 RepID=UPI003F604E39